MSGTDGRTTTRAPSGVTALAKFLLARIAGDEAATFDLIPYHCEPGCCAPAGWVGHRCLICGTEEFGGTVQAITEVAREHDERIHQRSRVLAECAAKRRIVTQAVGMSELSHITRTEDPGAEQILAALALPYSQHPNYQQGWRP